MLIPRTQAKLPWLEHETAQKEAFEARQRKKDASENYAKEYEALEQKKAPLRKAETELNKVKKKSVETTSQVRAEKIKVGKSLKRLQEAEGVAEEAQDDINQEEREIKRSSKKAETLREQIAELQEQKSETDRAGPSEEHIRQKKGEVNSCCAPCCSSCQRSAAVAARFRLL